MIYSVICLWHGCTYFSHLSSYKLKFQTWLPVLCSLPHPFWDWLSLFHSLSPSLPPSLSLSYTHKHAPTHTHTQMHTHTAYSSFALWQSSLILILKSSEIMALYLLPVSAGFYLYQWSVEQDEVSEYTEISFCWLTFISVAEYSHLQKFSPWNLGVLCPPMISLNYSAKVFSVKWSLLTNPQKFSHFVCHPSLLLNSFFILFDSTLNLSRSPECA